MKRIISLFLIAVMCMAVQNSFGAAASADINTPSRSGMKASYAVASNTLIYAGTMVAINSSGYAVPAANSANYAVVGRAVSRADNSVYTGTAHSGEAGKINVDVERGVFGWTAVGSVSDANVGGLVYVIDDYHVAVTNPSEGIIAGTIVDYSDSLLWVDTFNIGRSVGSFTTLAASGAATLSSTLGVSGTATLSSNILVQGTSVSRFTGPLGGSSTFNMAGASTFSNSITTVGASGDIIVGDDFTVVDDSIMGGDLTVTGALVTASTAVLGGNTTVGSGGNLIVGGTSALTGTVTMTGNATVGGTLGVTGIATFTAIPKFGAALGTANNVTVTITNAPTGASTVAKWIKVYDANGTTNYVAAYEF